MIKNWWNSLKINILKIISLIELRLEINFAWLQYINLILIDKWTIKNNERIIK